MPITQEQLADAVALTPVHVNRTLMKLEEDGLINRTKRVISITDWKKLAKEGDFQPRYLHLDSPNGIAAGNPAAALSLSARKSITPVRPSTFVRAVARPRGHDPVENCRTLHAHGRWFAACSPDHTALNRAYSRRACGARGDARQRDAVASIDLKAIAAISHANLRVNAPNNRILTRDDLVRMVGSGEIRNEVFERVPETVVVTGNVGVVMGHETVFPGADSEQARMYGRKTLDRRYTNVFLREGKVWRHLARHANVIGGASK